MVRRVAPGGWAGGVTLVTRPTYPAAAANARARPSQSSPRRSPSRPTTPRVCRPPPRPRARALARVRRPAGGVRPGHGLPGGPLLIAPAPPQPLETALARDRLTAGGIPCLQTTVRRYSAERLETIRGTV